MSRYIINDEYFPDHNVKDVIIDWVGGGQWRGVPDKMVLSRSYKEYAVDILRSDTILDPLYIEIWKDGQVFSGYAKTYTIYIEGNG